MIGRARIRGIKGVIVDYLQLVGGKRKQDTEEYHLRAVAQWLADMARQTGLWVLVACQLNQDGNTRGGEGLRLAADMYLVMHREQGQSGAWLEMADTRFTLNTNIGSEMIPAIWLRKRGPHFSDEAPGITEWPKAGAAA